MMQVEALIIPGPNANFDFGFMSLSDREKMEFVLYIFFSKREGLSLTRKAKVPVPYKDKMEREIAGCSLPRKNSQQTIRIDGLAAITLSFGLQLLHLFTRVKSLGLIESEIGENHVFSMCVPEENAIYQDVLFGLKKDGVHQVLIAYSKQQVEGVLDRYGNCFSTKDEISLRNAITLSGGFPDNSNRATVTIGGNAAKMLCIALLLYNTQECQILGDPTMIDSFYLRVGNTKDESETVPPEDWN